MADEAKWCTLCQRNIVPKKKFNSIGWVGLVAGVSFLVAALFNESLSTYVTTNALAAAVSTGVGNIMLNVLLLLIAPLFLISIVYCVYYLQKERHCPICNSHQLTAARKS
jgi:hypothetical protein